MHIYSICRYVLQTKRERAHHKLCVQASLKKTVTRVENKNRCIEGEQNLTSTRHGAWIMALDFLEI